MELVKLKNMKAKTYKQRAGSGAGVGLGVAECSMAEGHSFGDFLKKTLNQKNPIKTQPNKTKSCSLSCGDGEV